MRLPFVLNTFAGAPWRMLIASTYSMRRMTSAELMYSPSQPPNCVVKLYFPSEKAPAPPKPRMMLQGLQPMQLLTLPAAIGQQR